MEQENFAGKVVVVTGASAGLGRAIVQEFAKHGSKVALIARGEEGLEGARKEIENLGEQAMAIIADVSKASEVESAAQQIEEKLGEIDIWINNAMISIFSPFTEIQPDEFKQVTEVTYLGQVYGTMSALKRMKMRNRGTIVLIGSALAYRGIPLQTAYCGAKHGIHGFFESLRAELIHDNSKVQLIMVQLPAMNTTQFGFVKNNLPNHPKPMGTIFEPEVAARAVLKAVQSCRREMYVGFSTVKTIWGNKLVPEYLDNYLAETGYEGQQTSQPKDPNQKNNLWKPLPGDHGIHGSFSAESKKFSPQVWADTHKIFTAAALASLACLAGIILYKNM